MTFKQVPDSASDDLQQAAKDVYRQSERERVRDQSPTSYGRLAREPVFKSSQPNWMMTEIFNIVCVYHHRSDWSALSPRQITMKGSSE